MDSLNTTDKSEESLVAGQSSGEICLHEEKMSSQGYSFPYTPLRMNKFEEKYIITETVYLNELACARIMLLEDHRGVKYAAKVVEKCRLQKPYLQQFSKNEIIFQSFFSKISKNVVKVIEYYEDHLTFLMVMEYSYHPTYFEDLLENQYQAITDEGILRLYAFDILSAIKVIHDHGVIHCDIKPQNFLLFHAEEDERICNVEYIEESFNDEVDKIKLTDFGLAHFINPETKKAYMKYRAGTHEYKAPEVKDDCYVDCSIDIWSFGVTLYKMAVAYFPTAYNRYKYGQSPISFRKTDWKDFNNADLIQDLITRCFKINPAERITAEEALDHAWFKT